MHPSEMAHFVSHIACEGQTVLPKFAVDPVLQKPKTMVSSSTEPSECPAQPSHLPSIDDCLCDDMMWEVFRKLPLQDLIRIEAVNHRWQYLRERVLHEKTRLVLLDESVDDYPENSRTRLCTAPACNHLTTGGNLFNDVLLVPNMYHLVSFLYYIAPRLNNIHILYVSIYWATPEQLSQVLNKFNKVHCLTLFGKPTEYCCEWIPLNTVLREMYANSMKHFVTNFHLWPEKHIDPLFEPKIEAFCNFIDFILRRQSVQMNDDDGNQMPPPQPPATFWARVKSAFAKFIPIGGHQTIQHANDGQPQQPEQPNVLQGGDLEENEELNPMDIPVEEDEEEEEDDEEEGLSSILTRFINQIYLYSWACHVAHYYRILCGKSHTQLCSEHYFNYLHQLEELHIPGHFNRYNDRIYSFSSTVANGNLLKRLTIGDCKILHACSPRMFASLLYLDINDIWIPEYAYLYENLAQCVNLVELKLHLADVVEETTLDLIDFLEEGCVKQAEKGFQSLRILVLDFPMASLSRQYFIKFRSIFPALHSLAVNVSRIKWYRRAKLIKLIENPTTGLRHLNALHILSNGTSHTMDWLEDCTKIDTFNLTNLRLGEAELPQLKVFVKIALTRASKKKTQDQVIRLEVTCSQIRKIKAKYTQILARSGKASMLSMVDNIRLVPMLPSPNHKLISTVGQYGVDSF